MVRLDSGQSKLEPTDHRHLAVSNVCDTDESCHVIIRGATLVSTLLRVGMLAVLRSKKLEGRTIGVMITASHNPAEVRQLSGKSNM